MAWACDALAGSEILESPCQLFVLAVLSSAARNPFAGLIASPYTIQINAVARLPQKMAHGTAIDHRSGRNRD
jgi:hypothetical protein